MKRILVPVSFSKSSKNSLHHANSIFKKARLTLLNVYPVQKYSRKYVFDNKKYATGISEKLWQFYADCTEKPDLNTLLLTHAGATSGVVAQVSKQYDLMVMSRKAHPSKKNGYFSQKKLSIVTAARCPVLIMPFTDTPFNFENCEHIWHIQRQESETKVVQKGMEKFGINPEKLEVKSLEQRSFLSDFWKNMVSYEKSHNQKLIKKIDKAHNAEPIELIVLVDNEQAAFTNFFKSDIIHLFCKYDIPILVFPSKKARNKR